jgi:hypothetical protein
MPTVVVRHKVGDFAAWLKCNDNRVRIFAPAVSGVKTFNYMSTNCSGANMTGLNHTTTVIMGFSYTVIK